MATNFFGLALHSISENEKATTILDKINGANAKEDFAFYENFNTNTQQPNGVAYCAWSAAAAVLVTQTIQSNFKMLV